MRVLFINENLGGHATMHAHLRRALSQGYPEIEAHFLDVPPPSLLRLVAGAQLPLLGRFDLDLQPLRFQLATSAWVYSRLRGLESEFDAVHAYTQNTVLLSAGTLRRVPSVVGLDSTNARTAYCLPYREPTRWTERMVRPSMRFETAVFQAAGAIVAKTDSAASSVREQYDVRDIRLRVIRPGIIPHEADPPAAPGTLRQNLPRIVFVGTQLERKGGNQLVRVHQRHLSERCELVLITREQVPRGRNLTVVNDISPGDSRLWRILRSSAVFAFPSRIDAFSVAVLEAMEAGLPVVACPVNGVPELVADGQTGLLVAPGDDRCLLAAFEALLAAPSRRASMGAAGRARLLERFDARREAAEEVALLHEVVAAHRADRALVGHATGHPREGRGAAPPHRAEI
ncbi:glycosyltransferase family 4 protein [Streptomyces sp. CA-251387]|uniref:glycosyltransferase family 4 protein n=1 Tax=Streptomyces sp. CA-251387 TaxID=3240064 RepID=UPI003D9371BD